VKPLTILEERVIKESQVPSDWPEFNDVDPCRYDWHGDSLIVAASYTKLVVVFAATLNLKEAIALRDWLNDVLPEWEDHPP
jgi:hypothetical protein